MSLCLIGVLWLEILKNFNTEKEIGTMEEIGMISFEILERPICEVEDDKITN